MAQPQVESREQAEVQHRANGIMIRRLVQGASLDVTEYTVPKGFTTGPSDHLTDEKAGYVVRGKVEISSDAGTLVVEAAGAFTLPAGMPHQFTVVEDSVIVQVRARSTP